VLSTSIGTTRELWTAQVAAFSGAFRVITCDTRGHGRSGVPAGEYTLERLGRDVLAVLDAEGIEAAAVCGISLGGLTAMWLGAQAPARISGLVLANTAARVGSVESWTERIALVRGSGMSAIADRAMPLWFSAAFRERDPVTVARFRGMVAACNPDGYIGCCAALRDADLREAITRIRCPTMVIAGRHDQATTIEAAEFIRSHVSNAQITTLDAAHLSNVEQAEAFNRAVAGHLS
jgi:3-oxoadipate enol-lactonase